jgi:metallo-beta-lactamase class B
MSAGVPAVDDPQFGVTKPFPPPQVGRIVADGGEVRLGNLMVTAMTTPGHAAGSLSWRWVSCDGGVCRTIVYADILAPVSNDTYRFSDHPVVVAAFRSSIAKIAASPCEILLTPTPSVSQMPERLALGRPLLDSEACKNYAAARAKDLNERLAKEAAPPAPAKP